MRGPQTLKLRTPGGDYDSGEGGFRTVRDNPPNLAGLLTES